MKRLMLGLAAVVLLLTVMPTTPASAIDIVPSSDPPTTSPILLTRYSFLSGNLRIVQVFNNSDDIIDLTGWKLLVVRSGSLAEQEVMTFDGLVAPETHVAAVDTQAITVSNGEVSYVLPAAPTTNPNITRIILRAPNTAVYLDQSYVPLGTINNSTVYDFNRTTTGAGAYSTAASPFESLIPAESVPLADDGKYVAPLLNECTNLRINEIGANLTQQFIELYNASNIPIQLSGCQVQTNRSTTASFVFGDEALAPGALRLINVSDTPLTLTKTTTGTVYVLSSDGSVEVDAREYSDMVNNTSLSMVNGVWEQSFTITPGSPNISTLYLPCEVGYERNFDTGRCNKVVIAASLSSCREDQYRSEETNRCRSIVSLSTTLTACKEGQYRSEETNRCRSVLSAVAELVPCRAGQERSLATNRCRNIVRTDIPKTAFAVVPIKDGVRAFVGWWALGGVGALAVGYAGWEWRKEVAVGISKIKTFFTSGK